VTPRVLFGRQVRLLRSALGISQEALAEKAKVHRTFIGQVERGETNVSLDNIVKLAHGLNVNPSKLLDKIK
jgi:transcriptional regulator with XRE-family HTH domain